MHRVQVPDNPYTLVPGQRRVFCPSSWQEDDAGGRPRYSRRDWARVLVLSCKRHVEPLAWASMPVYSIQRMCLEQQRIQPQDDLRWLLAVLDDFAFHLEKCLFVESSWPSYWRLSGYQARALFCHCLGHLESEDGRTVG